MGGAKAAQDEQDERGWASADAFVCQQCVSEDALCAALSAREEPRKECSFCGNLPATPLDVLLEHFVAGLRNAYDYAKDELFWDGREGGYQGDTLNTWDVVDQFADVFVGDGLLGAVRDQIQDEIWVAKDWAIPAVEERLRKSWDRFCHQVKYETRYVIWRQPVDRSRRDPTDIDPNRVLDAVGDLVRLYPEHLITEIDPTTQLWRARVHDAGEDVGSAKKLGTTPVCKSQSNRMSPAGIPMFYGALDPNTATAEATQGTSRTHVTVGAFNVTGSASLLDLTNLKPAPSIFSPDGAERGQWLFLHRFEQTLRAKASHREIDYVPTQIVTEYFLRIFEGGGAFDGIQYRSDVLSGRSCVVLDLRNDACVDPPADPPDAADLRVVLDPSTLAIEALNTKVWQPVSR